MPFEITTLDGDREMVNEATAYQLEGPFTTFFVADGGHAKMTGWSLRVASLRTDRIASIRRVESQLPVAEASDRINLRAV